VTAELSIACAVYDWGIANTQLVPCLDALEPGSEPVRFLLDNDGNGVSRNVASLYNVLARLEGPPVRIFLHADVTFPADFASRMLAAVELLRGRGVEWGALGAVGRSWEGEYVWGNEIDEPTEVCTLDSCCIAIDTTDRMTFDQRTFDGYHCFVEDYCMQCHAAGRGVLVVPVPLGHAGATYAREGSQWGRYPAYRKRLLKKWRRLYPGMTTT
jgi:hypothetical protein